MASNDGMGRYNPRIGNVPKLPSGFMERLDNTSADGLKAPGENISRGEQTVYQPGANSNNTSNPPFKTIDRALDGV